MSAPPGAADVSVDYMGAPTDCVEGAWQVTVPLEDASTLFEAACRELGEGAL
jgi:hypothetical protein